jgi:hypothetical protein
MDIKLIKRNHPPYLAVVPFAVLVAALGFLLFERSHYKGLGIILIAFAAVMPMFVWASTEDELGLELNDQGLFDRRLGMGLIPWSDVSEAHLVSKYGHDFVCLRLRDSEKYVHKLPENKKKVVLANHELGFRTFNIEISRLNMNKYDILNLIHKQIKKS